MRFFANTLRLTRSCLSESKMSSDRPPSQIARGHHRELPYNVRCTSRAILGSSLRSHFV
jgi:hypothetical protein